MNSLAFRICVVVAIVLGVIGVNYFLQIATEAPEVELPEWSLKDIPYELGNWHGNEVDMPPEITKATEAEVVVNRAYRDNAGHLVSLHTAMFKDPARGVYHSPLNCYAGNGWKKLAEETAKVKVADDQTIEVNLVTWEKEGDKLLVGYWYQLGQIVLYSRSDLGNWVRWEMRGQKRWPVLFKVMIQISIARPADANAAIQDFSEQIGKWLNQPEHQKYLSRWRSSKE